MIQLLFSLLFVEVALVLLLLVKTPLRKLVMMGLDRAKRGRGPLILKTLGGTIFVVLVSTVYSMVEIQQRSTEFGAVSPTDQLLMARHLLEASLMGYSLFLGLISDRLHHYIRELRAMRKSMEAMKKQNRGFEDRKSGSSEESKALEEEIQTLRMKVKQLQSEAVLKERDV
ncbi:uncharacterized protein LOC131245669 [Magnolia sinica]|uniref:uncharacterized protein LOC131245669 n=1 Tax=Magnolia sinica TaxID=86752 RepID=UPI002657B47B|nr:uncharacterized protein LOC131245669 [Magnolia sinica]